MSGGDERVTRGMEVQLARWRERLGRGEERVGWKIGLNAPPIQEALGIEDSVVGHLTGSGVVEAGGEVSPAGLTAPAIEPEVAIEVGDGGGIEALAPAIELVDLDRPFDDLEAILATNVFHVRSSSARRWSPAASTG